MRFKRLKIISNPSDTSTVHLRNVSMLKHLGNRDHTPHLSNAEGVGGEPLVTELLSLSFILKGRFLFYALVLSILVFRYNDLLIQDWSPVISVTKK